MTECPACGATVGSDANNCESCGARIAGSTASFAPVVTEENVPAPMSVAVDGPVLLVRKGPQSGESFFIDRERLTIGRDPESDIFLNDMTVSRMHAAIECHDNVVSVRDAGSLNGTYLNGSWVDIANLTDGDVLQIGTFQMVFRTNSGGTEQ